MKSLNPAYEIARQISMHYPTIVSFSKEAVSCSNTANWIARFCTSPQVSFALSALRHEIILSCPLGVREYKANVTHDVSVAELNSITYPFQELVFSLTATVTTL